MYCIPIITLIILLICIDYISAALPQSTHVIDMATARNKIYVKQALPQSIHRTLSHPHTHPVTGHTKYRRQNIVVDDKPDNLAGCSGLDFYVDVDIGQPGAATTNTYRMLVDSGSTTMAVAGYQCSVGSASGSCFAQANNPQYAPTNTSTLVSSDVLTGSYGGNTGWSGIAYNDQVTVGSTATIPLNFAVIQSSNGFFNPNDCYGTKLGNIVNNQGILGVAYSSLALQNTESWLQKIVQYENMPNLFSMQMCQTTGKIWMGGVPESTYCLGGTCDPADTKSGGAYVPIVDESYYTVNMIDAYLSTSGSTGTYTAKTFGQTIIDSGTTQITLPSAVFYTIAQTLASSAAFQKALPQASGISFFEGTQCVQSPYDKQTVNDMLPLITIVLCGDTTCATGKNFNLVATSSYLQMLITEDNVGNVQQYYCSGIGINPGGAHGQSNTILGYSFMNQFITIFDVQNSQIGLVPATNCPSLGVSAATNVYSWMTTSFGACSGTCSGGSGVQYRSVVCVDQNSVQYIDGHCSGAGTKPATVQACKGAAYCGQYDNQNVCPSTINCGGNNQGYCQAGMCLCINGYAGANCQHQPHITVNTAIYANQVITMNYSAAGQFSQTAMFVAPANYTAGAVPQTKFPRYISDIRSYTLDTTDSSAVATFSGWIPPTDNEVIGIAYSPSLYSYVDAPAMTTGDCSKTCQYGGAYVNGQCMCQCPTSMVLKNNQCTCSLTCASGSSSDSSCSYCTACPTANAVSRWTGSKCNQPYSPIVITLNGIVYSSLTGSQSVAMQHSLVSDIAYSIGVSDLQIVFNNVMQTGAQSINVNMMIVGTVGDADTTTVDGYAYNLKNYANTLLKQGLTSSYYTYIRADYAKSIKSNSGSSSSALSAVATWFANNYIYVIAGGVSLIGVIVSIVIVYKCCFSKRKPVVVAAPTPKSQQTVVALPRQQAVRHPRRMPVNPVLVDTAPSTAANTAPSTPQRRLSVDTNAALSPVYIVDFNTGELSPPSYRASPRVPHGMAVTPNVTRLTYGPTSPVSGVIVSPAKSPQPAGHSVTNTPVPSSRRRLFDPTVVDTAPNTVNNSPVSTYRSAFTHGPIPFALTEATAATSSTPQRTSSWVRYTTSDNRPYYYNAETGETSWVPR